MDTVMANLQSAAQFIKDLIAHIMNFFNAFGAGSEDAE